ncbi:hypothetical protein IAR55_002484 [Kwoniella newhampshirensis]|uniref:Uncharacterized protein n=1 Tax=Kwoniella newhampshirensis TaxID=1651941 RepID=A0AAW0YZA2_9TREE
MSDKTPTDLDQAERGHPTSFSSSSPPSPDRNGGKERAANRAPDFFNYHPPVGLVVLEFVVCLLVLLVCFMAPNGGISTIVKKGNSDFVGLLRECSQSSCQGWMSTAGSNTNSTTPTSSSSNSAAPSSARRRDLQTDLDLSSFYLTTGLASLVSFWMITISFYIFIVPRLFTSPPLAWSSSSDEIPSGGGRMDRLRRSFKIFAYRISRIYLFVLGFLLLGIAGSATFLAVKARSEDGGSIGIGLILLHASWILCFMATYLEISRGKIRRSADLGWFGFTCLPCAVRLKVRANKKWDSHAFQKGTRGEGGDEEADDGKTSTSRSRSTRRSKGSRDRSRSRARRRVA